MTSQRQKHASTRLHDQFNSVRSLSEAITARLSDADASVQSMPDASPAKWHLAHTTWFFETFVLRDHVSGYRLFDERWPFLFNSYYDAEGPRHARDARGLLTRPSLEDVFAYRAHVDDAIERHLSGLSDEATLLTLGLHHEQQHQELLLTDILHLFAQNPLQPALWPGTGSLPAPMPPEIRWVEGRSDIVEIGADPLEAAFAFDCESPRHRALLGPHALASRPVTNGEWLAFIEDGGYSQPRFWLADGWAWVLAGGIKAPLYWRNEGAGWTCFGLDGRRPMNPAAPATHISFYEADAYASWAGARLPSEAEWECAASSQPSEEGNQLDEQVIRSGHAPRPRAAQDTDGLTQMFGDVWEWTGSAYRPYPGFQAASGAVGEYNGKFMSGQCVLRGGSCATPRGHIRPTYRNFFYPHQRWQFSGVRLAKDL